MSTHTDPQPDPEPPAAVAVPFREYRALVLDAAAWRHLNTSPHVAELLAEWVEWDRRRTTRETSNAVSAAGDWRAIAAAPTYDELARRRAVATRPALTPHQIRAQAAASWARVDAWIASREAA
ncbi:hypothetical protein AB0F15_10240 [Amycolatopsis sp. NPDC026612]|uniref:hypothetical protein n=1 Tax=Amycolatopsis sp. NPDC026612 TaxID=3155466 RepID=UPI0033D9C873